MEKLRVILLEEYEKAGICPENVDTGAVIITGETSRKENAAAVVERLSDMAGEFVVATAGPDLESALAAKGAGATAYAEKTGARVLHMDIGGGTSNLALIEGGEVVRTGCLNVGGRLIKLDAGKITYVSPALTGLTHLRVGDVPTREALEAVAALLAGVLEMAAGLTEPDGAFRALLTPEATPWEPVRAQILSFSGGVADCIGQEIPWDAYGDLGPLLGRAIRGSKLCAQQYRLGQHTIRATVMGAGCYSTQLSGSTVYCRDVQLPRKGLPVLVFREQAQVTAEEIRRRLALLDGPGVLAMPGWESPDYGQIQQLAGEILRGAQDKEVFVCTRQDMAKALGQVLALRGKPCLCLDNLQLQPDTYLDIGTPVGPALPVVIKTLVL